MHLQQNETSKRRPSLVQMPGSMGPPLPFVGGSSRVLEQQLKEQRRLKMPSGLGQPDVCQRSRIGPHQHIFVDEGNHMGIETPWYLCWLILPCFTIFVLNGLSSTGGSVLWLGWWWWESASSAWVWCQIRISRLVHRKSDGFIGKHQRQYHFDKECACLPVANCKPDWSPDFPCHGRR